MGSLVSPITLWLIIGIVFVIAELFLPGLIIGFFGLGAIITCFTTWIGLTANLGLQVLVFVIVSLLLLILFHKFIKKGKKANEKDGTVNFNIEIGKIVSVTEFIDPAEGGGKVRYQGALWMATCSEKVAPGSSVKVIGCNNLTLIVEKTGE